MSTRPETITDTTPAGAVLTIRRSSGISLIEIDRWPIDDATEAQCAAVRALFLAEYATEIRPGSKRGPTVLAGPTLWVGTATAQRETTLLESLYNIEREVIP